MENIYQEAQGFQDMRTLLQDLQQTVNELKLSLCEIFQVLLKEDEDEAYQDHHEDTIGDLEEENIGPKLKKLKKY